jgi:hypothetical protein
VLSDSSASARLSTTHKSAAQPSAERYSRSRKRALVDEARATSAAGRQRAARLDGDDRQQRRIGDGAVGHAA